MAQPDLDDEVEQIAAAWGRERPGLDTSSIRIATPIRRLASGLKDARRQVLADHGLDEGLLDVLGTLRRAGPPYRLSAGELSRRCRVTPGATTQRVARLEDAGLVQRVREEPDRRTVHVQLTGRGSRRLDAIIIEVFAADERVLAPLTIADRRHLERILRDWLQGADLDRSTPAE